MARLRDRWLLPLGHLLVDVIVLSHFIWQGHLVRWTQKHPWCAPPVVQTQAPAQESGVGWGPMSDGGAEEPWDFIFVLSGTLPAGLISHAARPEASLQDCARLWDPVWFSIHESIALLFWFLVGAWQESPTARLRELLAAYLWLRIALAPLCWLKGLSSLGSGVEVLFWLVFCICALVQGCPWLLRRFRARP
jgi:hypothetical protein